MYFFIFPMMFPLLMILGRKAGSLPMLNQLCLGSCFAYLLSLVQNEHKWYCYFMARQLRCIAFFVLLLLSGCNDAQHHYSQEYLTGFLHPFDGENIWSVVYAIGYTNQKVDWIVFSKTTNLTNSFGSMVETKSSGNKTIRQAVLWENNHVQLEQNSSCIFDHYSKKRGVLSRAYHLDECVNIFMFRGHKISLDDFSVKPNR